MERLGTTIERLLAQSDPWAADQFCGPATCLPCNSRRELNEEARRKRQQGDEDRDNRDILQQALPNCTRESISYILECSWFRAMGRKRWYYGESCWSTAMCGEEHL